MSKSRILRGRRDGCVEEMMGGSFFDFGDDAVRGVFPESDIEMAAGGWSFVAP